MAQTINTNLSSLTAQRNQSRSQNDLSTAITRLSSGLRINSAKDDAAGLAISERFTSQIRGLNQAARNANDGISLTQTAEGALGSISSNLQRVRELAVQSANATNSSSDRAAMQIEVVQLVQEIDRVGAATDFNGIKVLDGSFSAQNFQIGANAGQTIGITNIASARTTSLGASAAATTTGSALNGTAFSDTALTINGIAIQAAKDTPGTPGQTKFSAYAAAQAINASQGTVLATANATVSAPGAAPTAGNLAQGDLRINGIQVGAVTAGTTPALQGTAVAAAINAISAASGVTATSSASGALTLTAADGRNIAVTATGTGTTNSGLSTSTSYGSVSLSTSSTQGIVIAGTAPGAAGFSAGVTASTMTGTALSAIDVGTVAGSNIALASVDAALSSVNLSRASLGAMQNRLSSTVDNLHTSSENMSSARSRIQDADFAMETANLSRAQVLQQAGTAMIAQANQMPQQVLQLLKG